MIGNSSLTASNDPFLPSQGDWQIYVTSPDGFVRFVVGPDHPPAGIGSARLSTGTHGDDGAELRNFKFAGTRVSDLTCLTYWTYDLVNNGAQWPFLSLDINYTGGTTAEDAWWFEPIYQTSGHPCPAQPPPTYHTWQLWDALNGCWWTNSGIAGATEASPQPLSVILAVVPDATIVNYNGHGGVRLGHGYSGPTDLFDGNVDLVSIGAGNSVYIYDFEPVA